MTKLAASQRLLTISPRRDSRPSTLAYLHFTLVVLPQLCHFCCNLVCVLAKSDGMFSEFIVDHWFSRGKFEYLAYCLISREGGLSFLFTYAHAMIVYSSKVELCILVYSEMKTLVEFWEIFGKEIRRDRTRSICLAPVLYLGVDASPNTFEVMLLVARVPFAGTSGFLTHARKCVPWWSEFTLYFGFVFGRDNFLKRHIVWCHSVEEMSVEGIIRLRFGIEGDLDDMLGFFGVKFKCRMNLTDVSYI